ncbi:acyl-CoA dehydrogenase family protein [Actinomadura sp. DC4]|uniref:acyl-CoA dehydrogenase family protein n=1 Tax=Actinomadura sp. DC4 TaxID=3055069 RepID=UPI0025B00294|nr:acyl-CoA dehydrogenase family protein [Actinomadura sp. DC4]MDN3357590.1 acyl-CoA dehydrogenase family protein [Actinomadura sp. DC4]
MDLTLDADQRDLRAGLRDHLARAWSADRLRAAAEAPASVGDGWRDLAKLGVFALTVPEAAGGVGRGLADAAVVLEELGRSLVPGPLVATLLTAALPDDPVSGAADGGAVVTTLDTADPVPVVEHLGLASHVVIVTDDGLFLLPAERLEAVPVATPLDPLSPVWHVTGPLTGEARGRRIGPAAAAARWRLHGTALTAALQVGVAQGGLDLAAGYARERAQFGRAIGSFQAVKHLLADSLVRVDLARAAVLVAALTVDDPAAGDPDEAVSAAKVLADDAATSGGRSCVQVHGGMGFTWEVLAHLYLKRAWVLETCFGGPDEHARRLADALSA